MTSSPIIIIRKNRNDYDREEISTETILSGSELTPEQNRANIVDRLRKDPTVFMVFDPDGANDETASLPSGFTFHAQFTSKDSLQASLKITCGEETVYEDTFHPYETYNGECTNPLDDLIDEIIRKLDSIDAGDYDYYEGAHPTEYYIFGNKESWSIYDAFKLLKEKGFQVERVCIDGCLPEPLLLVHENEVILIGSRYYDGVTLFLEMKRFFYGKDQDVETANRVVSACDPQPVFPIHREDGSWSYRFQMDLDLDEENFIEKMYAGLTALKEFVEKVEEQPGVDPGRYEMMVRQRNYFIYEVLDQILKMNKLLL